MTHSGDRRPLPRTISNPDMGMSTTFVVTADESELSMDLGDRRGLVLRPGEKSTCPSGWSTATST